jgi:hypothetical protein
LAYRKTNHFLVEYSVGKTLRFFFALRILERWLLFDAILLVV